MTTFIQFAVLGLGGGTALALMGQGLVAIYRGSGILNLAHGALALLGAYVYNALSQDHSWATAPAVIASVLLVAGLGALIQLLVMRPLAAAAPIIRLVASLAVLMTVQAGVVLYFGTGLRIVKPIFPRNVLKLGSISIPVDRLCFFGVALVITILLQIGFRRTTLGLAISAAAENEVAAQALGWSPGRIAMVTWTLGAALAGLAGVLISPLSGLDPQQLTLLIVPALAAALIGGFASFPLTFVGAMLVGIAQAVIPLYIKQSGASDVLPFVVIVALLAITGRALPLRSHVRVRLPRIGSGLIRPVPVIAFGALAAVALLTAPIDWSVAIETWLAAGIVLLSITVVTGYTGQVSLGQYALSGVGALVAGQLVAKHGWPFEFATVAGILGAGLVGLVFGLPALRTRGVNLGVITLALGLAVYYGILNNDNYTGGISGIDVSRATVFGYSINPTTEPRTLGIVALVCFVVTAIVVARLRMSRHGRQLIAVRANERAAAAVGVNVMGAKLFAFAIAAGIAGLGGILLAFSNQIVIYRNFDPLSSVYLVAYSAIGGLGYVAGSLFGGQLFPGAIGTQIGSSLGLGKITEWLLLSTGILLIALLTVNPDGLAIDATKTARRLARLRPPRPTSRRVRTAIDEPGPDLPARSATGKATSGLKVSRVSVSFGGLVAVADVSLQVRPGQVLGVIGPNGAGKTTLIDAITGFVPADGSIELNGRAIHRLSAYKRSRVGVIRSFQSLELFEDISVSENLRIAAERSAERSAGRPGHRTDWLRFGGPADLAIEEFELWPDLDKLPSELPYGRRRLVAIARAMVAHPSVLLLDEPGSGLSDSEARELAEQVRKLADRSGIGILLVEHNVGFVMGVSDQVLVLEHGRPIAFGPPEKVRTDPAVIASYLGLTEPAPSNRTSSRH